ncbi:cytochrome P450 [Sporodiniella umbellata]|nr:cytochrome P450 [Sporodiniella umbellata]
MITTAILMLAFRKLYSFFRVPNNLRHIPTVSFFAMARSLLNSESPSERYRKITSHAIAKGNGFYLVTLKTSNDILTFFLYRAKYLLENFPKSHRRLNTLGEKSASAQFLGSDNILLSNGESWKRQRKMMNPLFHGLMPVKTMSNVIDTLLSVIEKNHRRVFVTQIMHSFTLDVLGLTIFEFDFQALRGDPDQWASIYTTVVESLFDPISSVFSSFERLLVYLYPKRRRGLEAVKKLNQKFDQLTQEKRINIQKGLFSQKPSCEKDLLTLMLETEKDAENPISAEELRHNIAVFFLAGHDTTANALSFCLYNLAKNKRVQQKLRDEINEIFGKDSYDLRPTIEELKKMKYINLVIKENLRLYSPIDLLLPRKVNQNTTLGDTFIPKGSTLAIDASAIHRNPKFWKNPDEFIPERFGEGGDQEGHEGLTWIPFSNGSRQCIGMNFSLTEQRLTLAILVKRYEINVPDDSIHFEHIVYDRPASAAPKSLELTFTKLW